MTVQFDLKSEKVVDYIMNNFDYDDMDNNGVIEMEIIADDKSDAIKKLGEILDMYEDFENGYKILKARETAE